MSAAASDLSWSLTWEDDIPDDEHARLAAMFAQAFPWARSTFTCTRTWSSGRPELRLVAHREGVPVAHLGVLRRFLRVAERDTSLLIGDVGLVAVAPQVQGGGLGAELLRRAADALHALAVPFGFLTCGEPVAPFYARCGWVRVSGGTRMVGADGQVQVHGGASMVRAVHAPIGEWPHGCRVDRNGLEV